MSRKKTSITCNPLTLKWVNKLRRLYQYRWDREITLDETILTACGFIDWINARFVEKSTELDLIDYVLEKTPRLIVNLTEEELVEVKDVFERYMEEQQRIVFWEEAFKKQKGG